MAESIVHPRDGLTAGLPRIWVGFILAGVILVGEVLAVISEEGSSPGSAEPLVFLLAVLAAWIYWLYCVFRFHDAIGSVPGYRHPITPAKAVALHFVPLFNFYWTFRWPSKIALFVNWRTQTHSMMGWIPGVLVLGSVITMRIVDGFVGALLLFSAGAYISARIRRAARAAPVPGSAMAPPGYTRILPLSRG
jgi:hypothetical protein